MKTPAPEAGLTFSTTSEDSDFPYVLFFCVFGSLLAHAGTFFLFQVVYPQRVTIPQPAPHVSLLTPSSPENIALLRWIEAEDPALIANDNPVAPPGLAQARYRPSFTTPRTEPLGAPEEKTSVVRFPPAADRLLPTSPSQAPAPAPASAQVSPTTLSFTDGLGTRPLAKNPAPNPAYRATAPAEPTTLLIGVDSQGTVRFALTQHSSGDPALDDVAVAHLRNVTFAAAEAPMAWGFATFSWGADAYASTPSVP